MANNASGNPDRILDTVEMFLDTNPELEGSEVEFTDRGTEGEDGRTMTVRIDGIEYVVTVEQGS